MTLEERLATYLDQQPQIDASAYIAKGAIVIGAVRIGKNSSIWHNAVLRADIQSIEIGDHSNVQDGAILHLSNDHGVKIGNSVSIGHAAVIHACEIQDECLIGMQATVLDGAVIGARSIVAAGALVTKGTQIPEGSLVIGAPAKVLRPLNEDEIASLKQLADKYVTVSRAHKQRFA